MFKQIHLHALAVLLTFGCTTAAAENVEVTLADDLDGELNGYCLDIRGGNENVDTENGLQAHTCYSYLGSLGSDQVFDSEFFADNILYMPEYDVCAELSNLDTGATIGLATCNGNPLQSFLFSAYGISSEGEIEKGAISPSEAPDMCLTAANESRFGWGGTSPHQIRNLTLEKCSDELAATQMWRTRVTDD